MKIEIARRCRTIDADELVFRVFFVHTCVCVCALYIWAFRCEIKISMTLLLLGILALELELELIFRQDLWLLFKDAQNQIYAIYQWWQYFVFN